MELKIIINKFPEHKPEHNQTVMAANHFYDEWWYAMYDAEKNGFWITSRDEPASLELVKHVTRWFPLRRPCFMFDQDDGSLEEYICPKCHKELNICIC